MRTLQTTKAGNKRMKLLRLLVGRAIDHTHEEKKKSRSRFPVAQPFFSHAKKSLLPLLIFLICIRIYHIAASFQFSSPRAHSSIINHVSSRSCISTTNNSFIRSYERLSLETWNIIYESLNDGKFTESTQLTKCAARFNFHWSNTTVSFETDPFSNTLCKF